MDADFNENGFGNWSRASEDVLRHRYPVHRACRDGDIDALSLLIVSGQQNLVQEDEFYGWSPAHWAAYFGQVNAKSPCRCMLCLVLTGSCVPSVDGMIEGAVDVCYKLCSYAYLQQLSCLLLINAVQICTTLLIAILATRCCFETAMLCFAGPSLNHEPITLSYFMTHL